MSKLKQAWEWYASHVISIVIGFEFNLTRWAWLPVLGATPDSLKSSPGDFEYGLSALFLKVIFGWYRVLPGE